MEKKQEIYSFGDYPKLHANIVVKVNKNDDIEETISLFHAKTGKFLFDVHAFEHKTGRKDSLQKKFFCYDDFFVISSHKKDPLMGGERDYFRVYDYDALLLFAKRDQSWGDKAFAEFLKIRKYMQESNERYW